LNIILSYFHSQEYASKYNRIIIEIFIYFPLMNIQFNTHLSYNYRTAHTELYKGVSIISGNDAAICIVVVVERCNGHAYIKSQYTEFHSAGYTAESLGPFRWIHVSGQKAIS
jgi:hypothetical protein